MENWNAQMMLDLYIYNFLMKKNMHTTAEIFAREANFHPKPVAIEAPEGFLSEWWSFLWSAYSSRSPNPQTTEGSASKPPQSVVNVPRVVVHPTRVVTSPNLNHASAATQGPRRPNPPQTTSPTILPKPDTEKLLQNSISAVRQRPNSNLARCIPVPITNQSVIDEGKLTNLIDTMPNQEHLRLSTDELNFSGASKKVDKKRPLYKNEDHYSHTSLRIEEPTDASVREQDSLGLNIHNFNPNSQLLDAHQLAHAMSFSNFCSNSQNNVYKKPKLSYTRDKECGTSSSRSTAAEPTHNAPKGMINYAIKF